MWFSQKALVFVDTRSAAVAVYKETMGGPTLLRFAHEGLESRPQTDSLFKDVVADASAALARLVRETRAGGAEATLLLPLGAVFPSILEAHSLRAPGVEVEESQAVRFRIAPALPFPVAQAEVRSDTSPAIGVGVVLAQAIPKTGVEEGEKVMNALGFKRPRISSTLSAALRGLPPRPRVVDLVLGDSACAIAVRNDRGSVEAIHLRLLLEGDDRARRSLDEARRATAEPREIRVLGGDAEALRELGSGLAIEAAFVQPSFQGGADPQRFPFLSVFHARGPR